MSYVDFYIFKEHIYLQKKEKFAKTKNVKDFKTFHETFTRFLKIVVFMQNALNSYDKFDECFNKTLKDFYLNYCSEYSHFNELEKAIKRIEMKNNRNTKISKFTLKFSVLAYQRLMDFPLGESEYETLTTSNFFENIHKLINVKTHLHHSHITGNIYGYTHEFCNMKLRENSTVLHTISLDSICSFYFFKEIRHSVWKKKRC